MSSLPSSIAGLQTVPRGALATQLPLLLILLSALILRLLWMTLLTGTIDQEGGNYARIAENLLAGQGYVGLATEGTDLMFPPLFPLMIAAVSLLTQQSEIAGRLISVAMGTLLVLPVFLITSYVYNRSVAYVAATLTALHPLLVGFSATVYCETTYLTLVMTAVYCCLRCQDSRRVPAFFLAGLFFGLAYLVRPEAILYPFLAVALILGRIGFTKRDELRAAALCSALLLAVFVAVATPYIAWLSAQTGQFRLEGKGIVNYAIGERVFSGTDIDEAMYGIDTDLNETGIWMQSNRSVLDSSERPLSTVLTLAAVQATHNFPEVIKIIVAGFYIGSPILFALCAFGLVRTKWTKASVTSHLMIAIVPAVATLVLATVDWLFARYLLTFVPAMLVPAAKGLEQVSASIAARMAGRSNVQSNFRTQMAIKGVIGCMLLGTALLGTFGVSQLRGFDFRYQYVRDAAEWLERYQPGPKTIMDTSNTVPYHAGGSYVHFPHADPETTLRYIAKKEVDFLVLREPFGRPLLRDWIEHGIPDKRAELIYIAKRQTPELLERMVDLLGSSYLGQLSHRLVARLFEPRPLFIYKWNREDSGAVDSDHGVGSERFKFSTEART